MRKLTGVLIVVTLVVGLATLIYAGPGRGWYRGGPGMMGGYYGENADARGYGGCWGGGYDDTDARIVPEEDAAKAVEVFVKKNFVDAKVGEIERTWMMRGTMYGAEVTLADGTKAFLTVDGYTGEPWSVMFERDNRGGPWRGTDDRKAPTE